MGKCVPGLGKKSTGCPSDLPEVASQHLVSKDDKQQHSPHAHSWSCPPPVDSAAAAVGECPAAAGQGGKQMLLI